MRITPWFPSAFTLLAFVGASSAVSALAAPVAIGLGDFSGNETIIDFESISDEELIDTQFSGQGVTFGGAIYGMTNIGDVDLFPTVGDVIASNWLYSVNNHQGTSFTATFDEMQNRVGFFAETNSPDSTTISVEVGGNPSGPLVFNTSLDVVFIGVEDLAGFDSVTISVTGPDNNFLAIDDFRFDPVPEPATFVLAALGSLAVGLIWQRRK